MVCPSLPSSEYACAFSRSNVETPSFFILQESTFLGTAKVCAVKNAYPSQRATGSVKERHVEPDVQFCAELAFKVSHRPAPTVKPALHITTHQLRQKIQSLKHSAFARTVHAHEAIETTHRDGHRSQ